MPIASPPPETERDRLYSTDELAELWNLGRSTIDRLRIRGELRAVKVGRVWRFRPVDMASYLAEHYERTGGG